MKINKLFILLLSLMLFILSCGSQMPFDPRSYNRKDKIEGPEKLPDGDGDYEIPSGNEDPFEKHENNDINAGGFDGDEMKDWFITARFLDGNIPEYQFLKSGKTWIPNNVSKNESYYYGDNTTALGNNVSSVEYYRYMGKNPMYGPTGGYNTGAHGKRIERFVFYRFTGKALSVAKLDNLLIAVDTYTKLVFAYGAPTNFDNFGNPKKWVALDDGTKYKFYEYDPVGIMHSDGSIVLYDWFKENQRNGRYNPDEFYWHDYSTAANTSGPGKSPYFAVKEEDNEPYLSMKVSVKNITLKNIDVQSAIRYALDGSIGLNWKKGDLREIFPYAYLGYDFRLNAYSERDFTKSPQTVAVKNVSSGAGNSVGDCLKLNVSESASLPLVESAAEQTISYKEGDQMFISFDYKIDVWNEPYLGSTPEWPYRLIDTETPAVVLSYDKTKNAFVFEKLDGDSSRVIGYTENFEIRSGETKSFTVTIDGKDGDRVKLVKKTWLWETFYVGACGNGPGGYNDKMEITYTLSVE